MSIAVERADCVRTLIKAKANVNQKDKDNQIIVTDRADRAFTI